MRIRYRLSKVDFGALGRIYRHFGGLVLAHKGRLTASVLALLGTSFVAILTPWPLKIVFDYVLVPSSNTARTSVLDPLARLDPAYIVGLAAASVLILAIAKGLCNYSHAVLSKTVGHRMVAAIRMQLFSHVQRLPQSYHDYRDTGELMTRMTGDISLLQNLLVGTVITLVSKITLIVGMLAVMFWLDWQLALVIVALLPMFMLAAFRFSVRIQRSARKQREMYGRIVSVVQETFSGIAQVKANAQENRRERLIGKSVDGDVKANVKTTRLEANYARIVEMISAVGICVVLWMGTQKALSGQISPGDVLVFISYVRGIYRPIRDISRLSTRVAKGTVRGEKIIELLEMEPEVMAEESGLSARTIKGKIDFDRVNFAYNSERTILEDFSCNIPAGKTTLIIGPTGAGKSTLARLILRLYEPSSGTISIDDRNVQEYKTRSLRKRVTQLVQEAFLFKMSLAENIAFGSRKISREDIEKAAKAAGAGDFIECLADGYDTVVGERGQTLSGGQRQKISFARAALRQSPVMIFDEPVTGLDVISEMETKEVLQRLRVGRTMIIITHRLHFVELADWVVFIRDGKLVEQGIPGNLVAARGEFYEYYMVGRPDLAATNGAA
ncbi:MAG: ABC transporter ATP-binding protein [Candidatus Zixiibacteriota bacterium]